MNEINNTPSLAGPLRWAFVMSWGQRGVSTVVTFVLAALLGPHDFGLVAIAAVYVAFMQVFLEQGIGAAVIQRARLEPEHLDSAFWMNLVWGLLLTGVSIGVAGPWAALNHLSELERVIDVLSLLIPISALTVVQQAVLQRELKFKKLALRSNISALIGGACGIALGLAGAGVWALVAQQLVAAAAALVLLWSVSHWVPRARFSPRHARELLGFSVQALLGNVAVFVNRRSDALLMGIFFGPAAVGLYRLADRLVETVITLTTRPVQVVSFPHFSRLQSDPQALRGSVRACMRITLITTIPAMILLAASSELVMSTLGPAWVGAADPLKVLSAVGIGKAFILFTGPLLFAVAKPHFRTVVVWLLALVSAAALVVVALFLRGHPTSEQVLGVALSRSLVFVGLFVPISLGLIWRVSGVSPRSLVRLAPVPVASGLAAGGIVTLIRVTGVVAQLPSVLALLIVGGLGAAAGFSVLLALEPRVRGEARALWLGITRRPLAPSDGSLSETG
jgi:polysaccharide transporter, PST family